MEDEILDRILKEINSKDEFTSKLEQHNVVEEKSFINKNNQNFKVVENILSIPNQQKINSYSKQNEGFTQLEAEAKAKAKTTQTYVRPKLFK